AVRVLPAERPESVVVPESTVTVEPFHELRAELEPRRRRGWLGARFRTAVQNKGNTPVDVALAGRQDGEDLRLAFTPDRKRLEPGESAEVALKVRARKLIWFGEPVTWPFEVLATEGAEVVESAEGGTEKDAEPKAVATSPVDDGQPGGSEPLPGEFAQIPVLPKWLLIVLAALLALLLAWFALVRPAVQSTAKQAGTKAAQEETERGKEQGSTPPGGAENPAGGQGQGTGPDGTGPGGTGSGPGS
ncbi:hydrolytic protein, partial [Streptomyces sp. BF-3]